MRKLPCKPGKIYSELTYVIIRDYLKNAGYSQNDIKLFMHTPPRENEELIFNMDLRICDTCNKEVMWEGYQDIDGGTHCERCVHRDHTPQERVKMYHDDIMFWTEWHGY